jgi:THO complex subunit 1
LIQEKRCFKVDTKALEPGMNYYLNDVIFEMDPVRKIDDKDKCKTLKVKTYNFNKIQGLHLESS